MTMALLLMGFTGCSEKAKPCPKQEYPKLNAINKVPSMNIVIKHGLMDRNSTVNAFKVIKALRVSEHYYYGLIADYTKEFTK